VGFLTLSSLVSESQYVTLTSEEIVRVRKKDIFTEKGVMEAVGKLGEKYKD